MAKRGNGTPQGVKKPTPKKSTTPKGAREVPFGLGAIEQFNADREELEPTNLDEVESEEEEEALALEGLSDEDDYDWNGEEEDDEEIPEYDFDEDEYDRKELAKQRDEEDAELMGQKMDDPDRPFAERLTAKEVYATQHDKGDDLEEAKRLQKEQRAAQALEDFDFDPTPVAKSSQKSKEERMLDTFNADLENINLGKIEVETITKKVTAQDKAANLKEKLARLKRESPELLNLLKDFREKVHEVHNVIQPVLERTKKNKLPTSDGISFLEVKNLYEELLLSYCINISYYLMLKAQGQPVKDHPVIDQLVRIRAIIEKSKPIEKKLSYQIDKLIRTANLGVAAGGNEDLTEKPNPADLEVDSDEEIVDQLGLYRAPKAAEEIMETPVSKEEKRLNKEKQRLKQSRIAEFMREEYGDAPTESTPGLASESFELTPQERALEKMEEDNMRRKEVTKQDKRRFQKRLENQNDVLAGRADFGDMAVYEDDPEKAKDNAFMERKRMRAHMDAIDDRKRSLKNQVEGDADTYVQPKKAKLGQGMLGRGLLFDEEIESEEEADERRPKFEEGGVPMAEDQLEEGTKRKASKRMEANRGLVRPRNKDIKTPHSRQRVRYKKRMGKMGGSNGKIRTQDKVYSGEKRISKNVTKSRKYAD